MIEQLKTVSLKIDRQAILTYAEITDDFNPIHVDAEFAAKTAMGGVIAHGTLSLNLIWQSLAATFGAQALRGAQVEVKFAKPVRDGDTVEAGGSRSLEREGRYDVWVRNQDGVNVIEGTAELGRPAGGASAQ